MQNRPFAGPVPKPSASDYSKEPRLIGIGGNGGRVNLGAYGNTPEAALTRRTGSVYYIR